MSIFDTGVSPIATVNRIAVMLDVSQREYKAEIERFELKHGSGLALETYKQFRQDQITERIQRDLATLTSSTEVRQMLESLDVSDLTNRKFLAEALELMKSGRN